MSWDSRLRNVARNLAGVSGTALVDYAESDVLEKAGPDKGPDESQKRTPGGSQEDNASNAPVPTEKALEDPKTLFWDPFSIIEQMGYKERPSPITYATLKNMCWKMPIIQAIIQTRVNQMASFCRPVQSRYDLGYRIRLRESSKQPTKIERKWASQMSTLILRTGVTDNPRGRNSFEAFVRKLTWDSLIYDQYTFEVVPNRKGQPVEFYATDGATMRIADSVSTYLDEDLTDATRFVQIYDGMVIAEYTQEELCFGIRNARSDIRLAGYGVSEMEMLVTVITAMLFGWDYNVGLFRNGTAQKGILNFKGTVSDKSMRQFKRHWHTMLTGVANAWRTPITQAEELQWINMQTSARDMEYSAWYDFLIKIGCAMFCMDPVEVNFKYGNTGQTGGLQEASNREKVTESKERGLRPLLRSVENSINNYIIHPNNEDFEFAFFGLDAGTKNETAELHTKLVKSTRMVDELRAEDDLEPLPDGKGQVILDTVWLQNAQAIDQPEEPGGGEQGPGDENRYADGEEVKDPNDDDDEDFDTMMEREFGKKESPEDKGSPKGGDKNIKDDNKPAKPGPPDNIKKSMLIDVRL